MKATKKIISILLSFVLVTTAFTALPFSVYSAVAEESVGAKTDILFGDINGDGTIDFINDVIMVNNYINGRISFSEEQKVLADVNGDDSIDNDDIQLLNSVRQSGDFYSLPIYDQLTDAGFCGDNGDNVKYLLKNDGTLVIFGNGEMSDFSSNSNMHAPWINTVIKSAVIKNGVTSISQMAFYDCGKIERITIPDSVTNIGIQAFYGCENLTSVALPNSVNNIGNGAFSRCWNLISVNIPDSVTEIKSDLFEGCKFESITIPNSVTSIENSAFAGTNLTEISIPDSVKSIKTAFRDCKNLSSVTIGESLTSIFSDAFIGCTNLSYIKVAEDNPVYDSRNNCNAIVLTESNELYIGCKSTIIPNTIIV